VGYSLLVDTAEPVSLASNAGWSDFVAWVRDLPREESAALRHLCQYGWTGKVAGLREELAAALKDHAPQQADLKTTVRGLVAALPESAEVVSVTDGLGEDGGA
jgi:hypothetical protein